MFFNKKLVHRVSTKMVVFNMWLCCYCIETLVGQILVSDGGSHYCTNLTPACHSGCRFSINSTHRQNHPRGIKIVLNIYRIIAHFSRMTFLLKRFTLSVENLMSLCS